MSAAVTIVTCNSDRYIGPCLESLLVQTRRPAEIAVVDNASSDGTFRVLSRFRRHIRLFRNRENTGFAAAQNQAIRRTSAEWVLTLNPDVQMRPDFLERLLDAGQLDPAVGTVCGKLLSIEPDLRPPEHPVLDSTGIYFTPEFRHFDRGWGEPDDGRYSRSEYVFGASAAAALYRRRMMADLSIDGEFFDPAFFAYREDADVSWRAQLLGWRCLYTPDGVAHHVRQARPGPRNATSPLINMHSVKNRFLLRINNATLPLYARHLLAVTVRDAIVAGGCLVREQSSLPAFWKLLRALPRALARRRWIMQRRTVSDSYLASWFHPDPVGYPLDPQAAPQPAPVSGKAQSASAF